MTNIDDRWMKNHKFCPYALELHCHSYRDRPCTEDDCNCICDECDAEQRNDCYMDS